MAGTRLSCVPQVLRATILRSRRRVAPPAQRDRCRRRRVGDRRQPFAVDGGDHVQPGAACALDRGACNEMLLRGNGRRSQRVDFGLQYK
jgi:hypothetical protein